jgi:hypothetical protein
MAIFPLLKNSASEIAPNDSIELYTLSPMTILGKIVILALQFGSSVHDEPSLQDRVMKKGKAISKQKTTFIYDLPYRL